jgi:hypothetical protein
MEGCTFLSRDIAAEQMGITPGAIYHFLELEMAIGHAGHLREAAKFHPDLTGVAGRYFPVLWDGSDCWFAVDTGSGARGRLVRIEAQSDEPIREAYSSFDEFLADLVRANEQNDEMACFDRI